MRQAASIDHRMTIPISKKYAPYVALLLLLVLSLAGSGCSSSKQIKALGHRPPANDFKLIVLQPDIKVTELTAGGISQPREDWTNQARENIYRALEDLLPESGNTLIARNKVHRIKAFQHTYAILLSFCL